MEAQQYINSGILVCETPCLKEGNPTSNSMKIESFAESLRVVDILNKGRNDGAKVNGTNIKRKKWTRRKECRKADTN